MDMDETLGPEMDLQRAAVARAEILDALGLELAKTRSEAIASRRASGIEEEWAEDEEYYEGIDDANRGERGTRNANWRIKPAGQAELRAHGTGSTVFVPITRPYCDAAAARVADMLLPTDDRAWSIKPTPYPELSGGVLPERIKQQVSEAFPGGSDEERQQYEAQTQAEVLDGMKALLDEANEKARRAERRIEDWHVECQWHAEVRRVIEDAVMSGTGVLKGPIPMMRKTVAYMDGKIQVRDEIKPVSKRVDRWNFFPDGACGDSIHRGAYTWERDEITRKQLQDLRGGDYIDEQIDAALKEGPHKAVPEWDRGSDRAGLTKEASNNLFEIWYGYCRVGRTELVAAGIECEETETHDVMVTLVNNRVIKANRNHLDTGEFPYDVFVWQRRDGCWFGTGVSRQIRTPQRIVNAGARNLMDNAGLAGGPMIVINRALIEPANGVWELVARKIWFAKEDAETEDVRKAISYIDAPMVQQALEAIIMLGLKFAEDVTGLPMLMQGQQGTAPETVGGMQILNNNAGTVLRRVARLFDDLVTEPHVRRYYAYLLQWGEDEDKGDFMIDARGSSALVERDLQNQQIMQMGQMILNPVFGKDPKKWMDEYLKSQKLDPKRFAYEDEEWQALVEQMSQPQQDGSVEAANIRAQAMIEIQKMRDAEAERDRDLEIAFKGLDREIEAAGLQGGRADVLDKIKASLAETVLKLRTQKELSGIESPAGTRQLSAPPTEPAGRASNGNAFQQ